MLQSSHQHIEQHPDRRDILKHDGGGDGRLLNRQIVEVVRGGKPENSQQKELGQIAGTNPQRRGLFEPEDK